MRIVVKVGTSTLAHATGALNIRRTAALCRVLADIKNAGHELVLVSYGAIGMGVGKLHLPGRPADMPSKQAAAAVGQCELMYRYDKLFSEYGHTVAQVLVTGEDARDEVRSANIEATLNRLLALGALPIVNENDTVSTEEIEFGGKFGDNDTLSAIVAGLVQADLLVLLTDIDGLYDSNPRKNPAARLIPVVEQITPQVEAFASGVGSARGTGGMITKLHAGKIAAQHGIDMVIMNGSRPQRLYDLLEGQPVGTYFPARRG